MHKRRLNLFLIIFLLFLGFFIPNEQIINAKEITSLQTSYYEPNNFDLELENGLLIIKDIPDSFRPCSLWFSLYSEGKQEVVWKEIFEPNQETITIPLSNFIDGTYRLYLYYNDGTTVYYHGYWWDEGAPKITKNNNSYSFKLGEYYDEIREVHNKMVTYDYVLDYYKKPSYWVESDDKTISQKALEITKGCSTDYEKIYQVYEWVINNIYYDYDGLRTGNEDVSAISVLKNKRSVCQGYADLTAALLRSLGIPTMVVGGNAASPINKDDLNHAWNMAYADGRWIFLDSTWDSHNRYENGIYHAGSPNKNRMWFDMSLEMIAYSHYCLDDPISLPILNELDYKDLDIDLTYGPVSKDLKSIELPAGYRIEYKVVTGKDLCTLTQGKINFTKTKSYDDEVVVEVNLITDQGSETLAEIAYYLYNYCNLKSQKLSTLKLTKGESDSFYIPDLEYVDSNVKYTITYKSSNTTVATVSKKGVIKAKGKGKCTITAVVKVGSNKFTFTQSVTVK